MPTLEELEALTKGSEQPMEPVVAAPASIPVAPPTLEQLTAIVRPELDTSMDARSNLNKSLEWQEQFEPGVYYKGTQQPFEEGKREAERLRFEGLSTFEKAKKAAGFAPDFQSEPIIAAGRGFANPILDTIQLPGHLAKTFHEADVFGNDGVEFDYGWDKPLTSLLYGVTDITERLQRKVNEGVDPERGLAQKLPEALGSAAAFLVGGRAVGAERPLTQALASGGFGAGSNAASTLEEAAAYGATPEDQLLAAGAGAVVGSTEGLPGFYFLRKLNQLGGGKILEKLNAFGMQGESTLVREAVKGALTEMLQEGSQTIANNWIANDLVAYDPSRTLGENFWDSVITAGLTGSMLGGGFQMLREAELNAAKQKLEEEYQRRLNSGDSINAIATPGNGFGSFTPVENLVALNKLKADLDRHIDQKAEYAYQQLAAEAKAAGEPITFPGSVNIPDDIIRERETKPSSAVVDDGQANFELLGQGAINLSTEAALLEKGKPAPTTLEALTKTPTIALESRYTGLLKEVATNIASTKELLSNQEAFNNWLSKNDIYEPEQIEQARIGLERRLKMLSLRQESFVKKNIIANRLLGELKNYTAAFRNVLNPDMKMVVRDSHVPVGLLDSTPLGWFTGSNNVKLADGTISPVGVMFIDLEPIIEKIYEGGDKTNSLEYRNAKRALFEVVNHELGHSIFSKHFRDVVNKISNAQGQEGKDAYKTFILLKKGYEDWLKDMSGSSWRSFTETVRPFQRAASDILSSQRNGIDLAQMPIAETLPSGWPNKDYLLSFDEFMADMTARLATEGQFADPIMTRFFQPVLGQYQKIFATYPEWAKSEYGNNWKEFLQSRSFAYKIREELEKVKAAGSSNLWDGLRGKVSGLNPDNFAGLRHQLDRWNKGLSLGLNLLQLEKVFSHVPQFTQYRITTEAWAAYQRDFADKATATLETWRSLGKKDAADVATVLYEESEAGKSYPAKTLGQRLSGEALVVYQQIRAQLNRVLDEMQQTALREANREHGNNSEKLALAQKEIISEFNQMRESGYFPYVRFGDWTITARAKNAGTYLGKKFKEGELITFQAFESRAERDAAYTKLRNALGTGATVAAGKMRESEYTVQGMPRAILLALRNRLQADGQLTTEVEKSIEQALEANAPFKNFRNHFKHKQGVHGYSEDAFRTFAHYIRAAAGNISRVRYAGEMRESIDSMQADVQTIQTLGGNSTARQEMVHWIRRHFDYIMNPSNELAALRGVGFVAYLGFNIKSAFVNSMQMFTTVYPYLAARFGDAKAVGGIGKAGAWLKKWVLNKKDFINAQPGSQELRIADLIARGNSEGWLDQSLATELAIAASENTLDRSLYLPSGKRWWHNFSRWSAWPFHMVEKTNRYVTAIAAYNLAFEEQGSHEKAILAAKLANQQTHFENARWNRPEFLRGKKSAALLFTNFVQNQLFFLAKDPGAVRYFCVMFLLAGVMGLPGADDLIDVMDAAATKLNKELGMKNPKVQLRVEMRKFLDEMGANPDLVMHGISQNSFGLGQVGELTGIPIPRFDLSRSVGMGNLIPGTEIPGMVINGGKPGDVALEAFSQAAGASGNLVEDYYRALFSREPNDWKRMEKLLPLMSMRNMSKAARYAQEGKERTANGVIIADFTPYDIRTGLEIFGQSLGFPIQEVQKGWEREIAVRDATQFYKTWQASIQRQLNIAYLQEDREAIVDALENLKAYNASVPMPEMGVKAKDAKRAVRDFIKSQMKAGMGYAAERKYHRLAKSLEEAFPDPVGDISSTDANYRP